MIWEADPTEDAVEGVIDNCETDSPFELVEVPVSWLHWMIRVCADRMADAGHQATTERVSEQRDA